MFDAFYLNEIRGYVYTFANHISKIFHKIFNLETFYGKETQISRVSMI